MYSQNKEEQWILEHFKGKIGNFLDIGAYDGKSMSNTWALSLLGWGGVLVEPSPSVIKGLMNHYKDRDNALIVNAAIDTQSRIIEFWDSNGDAISTYDIDHKNLWVTNNQIPYQKLLMKTITVEELLSTVGTNFDFINIDVEGVNLEVFKQFKPDDLSTCTAICIEYHDKQNNYGPILEIAKNLGFSCNKHNGENMFLER
jgi:FkbM family methyltransferase